MRRFYGIGVALAITAASSGIAAVVVLWALTRPDTAVSGALPGLHAPVVILFDKHGIPFIRASDREDAAEALGYLHARDRLVQMDLMRRAAGGTLAALIGPAGLAFDRSRRVLGTERAAEDAYAGTSRHTRDILLAYARGVNAYIDRHGRLAAPEYVFLGRPAPWRPVDSLLWAEEMGLSLSSNLDLELARMALAPRLSRAKIMALWPNTGVGNEPDAEHAEWRGDARDRARIADAVLAALPSFPARYTLPAQASNEWALDGSRTETGAPMLAGDPHLAYGLPCLWYLARIDTPEGTLAGATAPGVPFMVIGRNRRIAWTFTTAAADTEDVFVEHTLDPTHYAGPTGPLPFTIRHERIAVRGGPDVLLTVRETRHGPVISDLGGRASGDTAPGDVFAASIASLKPGNRAADGLEQLDEATNAQDAGRAAPLVTAPVQNLLVADRTSIGLYTTGRVPTRPPGDDGRFAVPGWTGTHDWTGWASGFALPTRQNPSDGILLNANEPVASTAGSPAMTGDPFGPWRADRIREVLTGLHRKAALADFAALQLDTTSLFMTRLLPVLLSTRPDDALSREGLDLLRTWNCDLAPDTPQPLIAEAWTDTLEAILASRAGDPGETATETRDFTASVLLRPRPPALAAILSASLSATMRRLAVRWGGRPTSWRWGRAHEAVFANPLWEQIPWLGSFRQAAIPVGGDGSTVDAQGAADGMGRSSSFPSRHGAAYRGVYDLADLDRSEFTIATGESGNIWGPHLLDFTGLWQRGGSVRLGPAPDRTSARLELMPAAH